MNEKLDELYSIFKALLLKNDNVNIQFLTYLDYNKFKYQPASTKHHYACEGGLLVHSLNVYVELKRLCKMYNVDAPSSVVGLLHDLCKIDAYIWSNGENKYLHKTNSSMFPHADKSLHIIGQYFKLTDLEAACIKWHMGAFHLNPSNKEEDAAFNTALEYPLVLLTHLADWISSRIVEKDFEKNINDLINELGEYKDETNIE